MTITFPDRNSATVVRGTRANTFHRINGIWLHANSTPDDWLYPTFLESRQLKREWSKAYGELAEARARRRRKRRPAWHLAVFLLSVVAVLASYWVTKRH